MLSRIKLYLIIFAVIIIAAIYLRSESYASTELEKLRSTCSADLKFIYNTLKNDSAGYKNPHDPNFAKWLEEGFGHTEELVSEIMDQDDCFFAINYYINGFNEKNLQLKPKFKMPDEYYPGILTANIRGNHRVIYKLPGLDSLEELKLGDKLLAIDDVGIDEFFHNNITPFYSYNSSEISYKAASTYVLVEDGNKFVPAPTKATFKTANGPRTFDLQYTKLTKQAKYIAKKYRSPIITDKIKIDMHSSGAWVRIPSFYPTQEEKIILQGILANLKDLAKQDYIVFDLRNNPGGDPALQQSILRNLFGDRFLKSLGKNHSYNLGWSYYTRLSKIGLAEFKKLHTTEQVKQYNNMLSKGEDFFEEKYDIYSSKSDLYSNEHSGKVFAQIVVLTDNYCSGSCWSFVNEVRQIPGAKHFGATTDIGSFYDRTIKTSTPDDYFDLIFPIRYIAKPGVKLGRSIEPHKKYCGDFHDDNQIVDWVLSELDDD